MLNSQTTISHNESDGQPMSSTVKRFGAFKTLNLPDYFHEDLEDALGNSRQPARTFSPAGDASVRMTVFDRGFALDEDATRRFRRVLREGERVLVNLRDGAVVSAQDECLCADLAAALGAAGNNQVVNKEPDWQGPRFQLDKLAVETIAGKPVLSLTGYYRDTETGTPTYYFHGIFCDASPQSKEANVHEFFLEAADELRFLRYRREFAAVLATLEWQ